MHIDIEEKKNRNSYWWSETRLNLLMIDNFLRNPTTRILANPTKIDAFEDFSYIRVSPELVALFLTGGQVAADEAEARLMHRHAYRYASLQIRYLIASRQLYFHMIKVC